MVRQTVHPLWDSLEETGRVVVVYNVCCAELQDALVLLIEGFCCGGVNFGVLDYVGLAVLEDDEADRLGCVSFPDNLCGEVDVFRGGETEEDGVGNLDEGVVDAVSMHMGNITGLDVGEDGGGDEGLVNSAITVGGDGNARFGLEDDFAFVGDARKDPLLEEDDVLLFEAEVVVFFEELLGGAAGRARGHDVPGDYGFLFANLLGTQLLDPEDPFGLKLEEGFLGGEADIKAALGGRGSEAGSLATWTNMLELIINYTLLV